MKRHSFTFFVVTFLTKALCTSEVSAQQTYSAYTFETRVVLGSHALGGKEALQDRLYGLDFSYQKNLTHLSDSWVKMISAKAAGISFIYRDLNNLKGYNDTSANSFGQAYGLSGHIDFQLLNTGRTTLLFRPAIGVSYLSKTFFTNKSNRFIGSHLNEILKFDLLVQVPVSSRVDLIGGAGFLHYSNGGFVLPNRGLNTLSVSTGLRFKRPGTEEKEYHTKFHPLGRSNFELGLGIGRRGVNESKRGLLKSGFYAGYNFFLNDLLAIRSGLDAVYYYTPFDSGRKNETYQKYATSYDSWRAGLSLGPELTMWRLAISVQAGRYLHYNSYHKNIRWYWTTGWAYHISPHVAIQAKPYFHSGQADFINYGLVFKL